MEKDTPESLAEGPNIHVMVDALQHEMEEGGLTPRELVDLCTEYATAYNKLITEQVISQLQRRGVINNIMLQAFIDRRVEIENGDV